MSAPDQSPIPDPKPRRSGVVVPHSPRWYQRLAAWLVFLFIRGISATIRYRLDDGSGFFAGGPPGRAIYCVWHNRLALCLKLYYGFGQPRNPTAGLAAMVSASKDGAFLAAI